MSDVKWVKISTDIFDDEKILMIESLPEADSIIVIWFKLLCLAGKQNNGGVFTMHNYIKYTDEMFATVFRRPLNTVRLAMQTFERFGMIEIINDTVTIPNWDKHQSLDSYEKRKERDRVYQQQRREKLKLQLQPPESTDNRPTNRPTKGDASTDESTDESTDVASKIRRDKSRLEGDNTLSNNAAANNYLTRTKDDNDKPAAAAEDMPFADSNPDAQRPDFNTIEVYAVNNLKGMTNPANLQELCDFRDILGEELTRYAINEACANGQPYWSYTRGILRRFMDEGIRTVGDAKAAHERYKQSRKPDPTFENRPKEDGWY